MRLVKALFVLAAALAVTLVGFPAQSQSSDSAYSLVKIWETPLDADSIGMLVAGCPDGSAYVISSTGTLRWISPEGVPSSQTAKVPSNELLVLAVCDAKRSVYLAGTHLRIFEAGADGVTSLVADAQPSELIVRFAVLPDGSVWVKYAPPLKPRPKSPSSDQFGHGGKHFPKTDPVLTESQVQALPGVIWSESYDTKKNEQEFRLSDGTIVTQTIMASEIAEVFKRLILTIHDPASPDTPSTIESDEDGVLSAAFDRNSLYFLYREYDKSLLRRFRLVEENEASAEAPSTH